MPIDLNNLRELGDKEDKRFVIVLLQAWPSILKELTASRALSEAIKEWRFNATNLGYFNVEKEDERMALCTLDKVISTYDEALKE